MSILSERVKRWRKNFKKKVIEGYGGKCMSCGYSGCNEAFDLHHVDPKQKEFNFGKVTSSPKAFEKILPEIKKCVLVCANCHREIHAGVRECPPLIPFVISEKEIKDDYDNCPVCGKKKFKKYKTCSRACAARLSRKVNWDNINLEEELKKMSISDLACKLGISYGAVKKRMKKINLE